MGQKNNLPDQMTAVRHSPNSTDRTTSTGELERALGSAHLEAFVQRVFFDCAVPSAGIDGVAIHGPTGSHAPGRYTRRGMNDSNGI